MPKRGPEVLQGRQWWIAVETPRLEGQQEVWFPEPKRPLAGGGGHPTEAVAPLGEECGGEILHPVSPPALQSHPVLAGSSRKPGAKAAHRGSASGQPPRAPGRMEKVAGEWREPKQLSEVTQPARNSGQHILQSPWEGMVWQREAAGKLVIRRTFLLMETSPNVTLESDRPGSSPSSAAYSS